MPASTTLTLVKCGPNPDLAAAFIDRMLDPVVQKGLAESAIAAPTIGGIELRPDIAKLCRLPGVADARDEPDRDGLDDAE